MKTWKNSRQKLLIIFFITGLAAQKAHFRQKLEFYRLSVSPLYNLLAWDTLLLILKVEKCNHVSFQPFQLAMDKAFL